MTSALSEKDVEALGDWIRARPPSPERKVTLGRGMALVALAPSRRPPAQSAAARVQAAVGWLAREDALPPRFARLRPAPLPAPDDAPVARPRDACPVCQGHGHASFAHLAGGFCHHCGEGKVSVGTLTAPGPDRSTRWKSRAADRMGPYTYAWGWAEHGDREARVYRVADGLWIEVYAVSYGLPADRRAGRHGVRYVLLHAGLLSPAGELRADGVGGGLSPRAAAVLRAHRALLGGT